MPEPLAVYVHIPFCPTKCGYCDFNSFALEGPIMERTADAIAAEVRSSPHRGRPASTIFFGGGTPTYLPEALLLRVFEAVLEAHPPTADAEITSEANPGTVDAAKFGAMRRAGFNRVSLGAQSFQESDLKVLGRVHASDDIARAVRAAREAGFENLNLDLMFGLPRQTPDGWRSNLERAIALGPDHLSLYCLTIEPNTPFYKQERRGELHLPDDARQVAMYDHAIEAAESHGYEAYEISNFARPGRRCRHNLAYWRGDEYAGYGPGAVGRVGLERTTNLKHPERYCGAVEAGLPTAFERESLDKATLRTERVMLGLRIAEGISTDGLDPAAVARVESRGWVVAEAGRVRLTPAGRHFCSEVAVELI